MVDREIISTPISVPPKEKIYIVCRSNSIADRWANRSLIDRKQRILLNSMLELKGINRDALVIVIQMFDDSIYFREEVGREKIYWNNLQIVRID